MCRRRATLVVVGNAESLEGNPRWQALVSHARKKGCMYKAGGWLGLPACLAAAAHRRHMQSMPHDT